MDFDHKQSSSSSSSRNELSPTTPIHKHMKKTAAGRKIFKETRHPIYRGVRRKNGGKWVCEVREPNKKSRIWLGTFPNPETAAVAHDVAALALRGDNAQLNFPGSAWRLPRAQSSSHQDIQRAAFRAAMDYAPVSSSPSSPCSSSSTAKGENFARTSPVAAVFGREEVCGDQTIISPAGAVGLFLDEEEMFNMPVLLDSMAEGLILTPLAMKRGFNWSNINEEDDDGVELTLWGN